jgi:nucleotide-binding universal stress UspA family protein
VNDPLLVAAAAASYDERALAKTSATELKQFVGRAIGAASESRLTCAIAQGDPAGEIERAARRIKADLIVLGTEGLSGARKLFFGSTTERVLRQAKVPVLAVPPAGGGPKARAGWPGPTILAALELGPSLGADARAAARVARWFEAGLLLAHVVTPTQAPRWLSASLREHDRERVAGARARLDRLRQSLDGDDLPVDCQVRVGDPAEQIAALATDTGTGLVVVRLRALGGFFGTPKGATTYRVLKGADTPILALPGR